MKNKITSHPQPGKYSLRGYTVYEIAVVTLISGVVMVSAIDIAKQYQIHENGVTNSQRLNDIRTALNLYALTYGHLPHPADRTLPQTNSCHGEGEGSTTPPCPQATSVTAAGGTVLIGAVPVRDFSPPLPDSDYIDVWGNQFIYAVSQPLVSGTSANPMDETKATINIIDATGGSALASPGPPKAMYVIDDTGPDGKGSYTINGVPNGIACGSQPGYDNTNCDGSGTFQVASYSAANSTSHFDDQLLFATSLMNTVYPVCPPNSSGLTSTDGLSFVCMTIPPALPPPPNCGAGQMLTGASTASGFKCVLMPAYPPVPWPNCGAGHQLSYDATTSAWSCLPVVAPPVMTLQTCANGVSLIDSSGNFVCQPVATSQNDVSCPMLQITPTSAGCTAYCPITASGIQSTPTGGGIQATDAANPTGMSASLAAGYGVRCTYNPGSCITGYLSNGCGAICHVTCLAPSIPEPP